MILIFIPRCQEAVNRKVYITGKTFQIRTRPAAACASAGALLLVCWRVGLLTHKRAHNNPHNNKMLLCYQECWWALWLSGLPLRHVVDA